MASVLIWAWAVFSLYMVGVVVVLLIARLLGLSRP